MNTTKEEVKQMTIDPKSIFQPLFEDYIRINLINDVSINAETFHEDDVQLDTFMYKAGGDIIATIEAMSVDLCNMLTKYGKHLRDCSNFNNMVVFAPDNEKEKLNFTFPSMTIIPNSALTTPRYVSQAEFPIKAVVMITEDSVEVSYYCDGQLYTEWCNEVDLMQPKYILAEYLRKVLEARVEEGKLESFTIHIDTEKFDKIIESQDYISVFLTDYAPKHSMKYMPDSDINTILNKFGSDKPDLNAVVKEDGKGYVLFV